MSLERLGRFRCVGIQSEQSSAHEVSDGVDGQEDRTPHDERDTKQPEARRSISVDPLIEVGELVLQHGCFPLQIRGDAIESFYQFRIRASVDALFLRGGCILVVASASPWLFKTSAVRPTKDDIHELLMDPSLQRCLGIYNPRLNEVYRISVDDIPRDVITEVDRDVIGYPVHRL